MEYKNNNEMSENNNGTVEEKVNFIAPEGIVTAKWIRFDQCDRYGR